MKPIPDKYARVDVARWFDSHGEQTQIKCWPYGWTYGQVNAETWIDDSRLLDVCDALKAQGFTVWLSDNNNGRALRGELARVDIVMEGKTYVVRKWPEGWTATTPPLTTEDKGERFDYDKAVAWLKRHGWTVYEWPGGARAWYGKALPVRTVEGIKAVRRNLLDRSARGENVRALLSYDLAFYL